MKQKVIFLGSKTIGYDCLQHLLEKSAELNIEVTAALVKSDHLLADSGKNILHLCEEHDLVLLPSLKDLLEFERPDFLISVQYHELLKQSHLDVAKVLAVNLHMAPLPELRGCNQFTVALLEEMETFGTTLHVMNAGIDNGDILFESRFSIPKDCWVQALYQLTEEKSLELFKESLPKLLTGDFKRVPQHEMVASRGTALHYRREIEQMKQIDLSWPPEKISRHIRATWFPPYDPPYAMVDGTKRLLGPSDIH